MSKQLFEFYLSCKAIAHYFDSCVQVLKQARCGFPPLANVCLIISSDLYFYQSTNKPTNEISSALAGGLQVFDTGLHYY